ncbi:MAG: LacI family DNA-binding transcriptional regulator [Rhizobiales bacterium]|nr:LacI family DNA-binding transcriptional regulator [Hyphomicrobiales bacterium]MBO6697215.1 LacI family DNA-binding transcriptional regulator [Hyphomicrobiales bacterium]MBO6736530.1 LacI family DNA-binding transcriptional regulator [Hyphomicrobiales bacterium]MBO6913000.1 LacI family DNA-binding transcriptional regulator [Hyphomicrobiales bacterium]MBO6956585.1 LacI family DNA-binding transcriptional regulator [Hyphomicrobiales bacterium]
MRPTLSDIAEASKVSTATVDRVMNARPGVSARTRALVLAAARQLGYLPPDDGPATAMRIEIHLPQGTNAYIGELARQAQEQAASKQMVDVTIVRSGGLDAQALAEGLLRAADTADAVAVVALNHPSVREAIRALDVAGVPVVTLASDIPDAPRKAFIGIDNGQAGRLAGFALGRFLGEAPTGKVALFAGTIGYRGHQEREMGFRQVLAEEFPALEVLELRESFEDRKKAFRLTQNLLETHSDLVGVYNAGGATVGIAAAVEDAQRERLVFVAHEVTPENKAYLLSGTLDAVIDQNARAQIRQAFEVLTHAIDRKAYRVEPPQLQLILRENLPPS